MQVMVEQKGEVLEVGVSRKVVRWPQLYGFMNEHIGPGNVGFCDGAEHY